MLRKYTFAREEGGVILMGTERILAVFENIADREKSKSVRDTTV